MNFSNLEKKMNSASAGSQPKNNGGGFLDRINNIVNNQAGNEISEVENGSDNYPNATVYSSKKSYLLNQDVQPRRDMEPAQYYQGYETPTYQQSDNRQERPNYINNQNGYNNGVASTVVKTQPANIKSELLGIQDPSVKLEALTLKCLDVKPIQIPEIRDKFGELSSTVEVYENRYDLSVVPLDITPLLPQVVELASHAIIEIKGRRYASSNERVVNEDRLNAYVQSIINQMSSGKAFVGPLLEKKKIGNMEFETLKFNQHELELLYGLFRNYNAQVLRSTDDNYFFVVGAMNPLIDI